MTGGKNILLASANWIVRISGCVIFMMLTWYALRYTHFMLPGDREITVVEADSQGKNLSAVLLFPAVSAGLLLLEKKISDRARRAVAFLSYALAAGWIFAAGMFWIYSAVRVPEGDQAFLYGGASYFIEGGYFFLEPPGGYLAMYPHQLILTALVELLFRLVGTYNYFAYEIICVFMAAAIAFLGGLLLREFTESMSAAILYSLTMMGCVPLVFYTSWVYGEIPSVLFILSAVWMLLRYVKRGKSGWLAGVVVSATLAVMVRKNSIIFVVALCLCCGVYAIWKKDKKVVVASILSVLVPMLVYSGVYRIYELRSGYEHWPGIPALTWIDMGMHESEGCYGWYDNSAKELYFSLDCDIDLTKEAAKENILNRLREFRQNPAYARLFYREKILSQWNNPLYQSFYFSAKYAEGDTPEPEAFVSKLANEYFPGLLKYSGILQLVIYFGVLLYFGFAVKPDSQILRHVPAVTIIGGFLFSILWEAKARYVFPYYVLMFPLAAAGYERFIYAITGLGRRVKSVFAGGAS